MKQKPLKKHTVRLTGHVTSITLEPEFWETLTQIAQKQKRSINNLIMEIDQGRGPQNLSSAVRVYALLHKPL